MRQNLETSLKLMFGDEGGYSNRKTDSGGPTKYGITHRTLAAHRGVKSVTADQVKNLRLPEAKEIYVQSYWPQSGGDLLPTGLDYAAFDFGVNSGPPTAVKKLQKVVGVKPDGWIGPATMKAVVDYKGGITALIADFCKERMRYLHSLKGPQGFSANGRGWTIRVTGEDPKNEWKTVPGVVGNALAMAQANTKAEVAKMIEKEPDPLPAGGDSKASPAEPNPWLKPDVLLPVGGAVATGAGTILTGGIDPVRLALSIAIIVVVALGAFYAFQRIKQAGATV